MGTQLPLLTAAPKVKLPRQKALPGNEGITWVRCCVCNRPIFDPVSRARKMGDKCFKLKKEARNVKNTLRNQRQLQDQLPLFNLAPFTK